MSASADIPFLGIGNFIVGEIFTEWGVQGKYTDIFRYISGISFMIYSCADKEWGLRRQKAGKGEKRQYAPGNVFST